MNYLQIQKREEKAICNQILLSQIVPKIGEDFPANQGAIFWCLLGNPTGTRTRRIRYPTVKKSTTKPKKQMPQSG